MKFRSLIIFSISLLSVLIDVGGEPARPRKARTSDLERGRMKFLTAIVLASCGEMRPLPTLWPRNEQDFTPSWDFAG